MFCCGGVCWFVICDVFMCGVVCVAVLFSCYRCVRSLFGVGARLCVVVVGVVWCCVAVVLLLCLQFAVALAIAL